jgi:hypothetical protein
MADIIGGVSYGSNDTICHAHAILNRWRHVRNLTTLGFRLHFILVKYCALHEVQLLSMGFYLYIAVH